jgi:hypothetical protein
MTATPTFSTPQSATAAVKRALRENNISTRTVRSSRTADDRYLSCIFMPQGTSDATYAKMAAVLTEAGYRVTAYTSTAWVAASSDASDR